MEAWKQALENNDQQLAKRIQEIKKKTSEKYTTKPYDKGYQRDSKSFWEEFCEEIGYPVYNSFDSEGRMTSHFRRVLVDIKLLSVFGGHTFPFKTKK